MNPWNWRQWLAPEVIALLALGLYPFTLEAFIPLTSDLTVLLIFAIVALGLNVVTGYTGLLQLGIAAFFAIGAYTTAILTIPRFPFQWYYEPAILTGVAVTALAGLVLGAPVLRLRGDYLALVTLGFGEVLNLSLMNLDSITSGASGLSPVKAHSIGALVGAPIPWSTGPFPFFYPTLAILIVVVIAMRWLENSRLGRAWIAVREDELAATCMGINPAKIKLTAFAVGASLAGLGGCLYVAQQTNANPAGMDFPRSITILCCLILGGLGSIRGTLLGVLLVMGYDRIFSPAADIWIQGVFPDNDLLKFSNYKLMLFGLVLILMMRFRPQGLLPSERILHELESKGDEMGTEGSQRH